ncbi:MAG: hypothetical protein M5U31_02125 [Acidimicrobiia bacterium]|nr:hypothetical protein [Acidimicrobiia bacterium]
MVDGSTPGTTASDTAPEEESLPPQGHVKVVYLGPVAPHWEVHDVIGDRSLIDAFRQRAMARLQLLPPHDPQFHRNRARVDRDAERERLVIEWDLGLDEQTDSTSNTETAAPDAGAPEAPVTEAAPAETDSGSATTDA